MSGSSPCVLRKGTAGGCARDPSGRAHRDWLWQVHSIIPRHHLRAGGPVNAGMSNLLMRRSRVSTSGEMGLFSFHANLSRAMGMTCYRSQAIQPRRYVTTADRSSCCSYHARNRIYRQRTLLPALKQTAVFSKKLVSPASLQHTPQAKVSIDGARSDTASEAPERTMANASS